MEQWKRDFIFNCNLEENEKLYAYDMHMAKSYDDEEINENGEVDIDWGDSSVNMVDEALHATFETFIIAKDEEEAKSQLDMGNAEMGELGDFFDCENYYYDDEPSDILDKQDIEDLNNFIYTNNPDKADDVLAGYVDCSDRLVDKLNTYCRIYRKETQAESLDNITQHLVDKGIVVDGKVNENAMDKSVHEFLDLDSEKPKSKNTDIEKINKQTAIAKYELSSEDAKEILDNIKDIKEGDIIHVNESGIVEYDAIVLSTPTDDGIIKVLADMSNADFLNSTMKYNGRSETTLNVLSHHYQDTTIDLIKGSDEEMKRLEASIRTGAEKWDKAMEKTDKLMERND